ncbi:hypothetical protein UFOVP700_27 [uncultured Caudovirales phage]|uniref:Uncharacterized protein n=1 Tax=uncultured Caudovirales phage TaxID=2100421 RepID=A0A6J5NJ38_9CAUD|nr:hypothetical protein UFOVP700_27 [uncultured Caudovirales phage]
MRTELLAYLTANLAGTIRASQELPFEESGNPLYLKNMRRVYLNEPVLEQSELIATLDTPDIVQTITTVRGFLTVDAKNRNSDLDTALNTMAAARNVTTITNAFRKEFDYTPVVDADRIIYEFEYRFYTLA